MRRQLTTLLAAGLVCLTAACDSDKKEIARVAQGYLEATGNYRIDEAMPYANQETRETTLTYLRDNLIPDTPQEYIDANTPATIVIDEIVQIDDTAVVFYTKTTPIKEVESEILVVREEGGWLVSIPMEIPDSNRTNHSGELISISKADKEE